MFEKHANGTRRSFLSSSMMLHLRQLAAALLVTLMVPSFVLAAMPIRYCMSPAGHHALEFVLDGVEHGGEHSSHPRSVDHDGGPAGVQTPHIGEVSCTDSALIDSVTPTGPNPQEVPLPALLSQAAPPAVKILHSIPPPIPDRGPGPHASALSSIRTTILRI